MKSFKRYIYISTIFASALMNVSFAREVLPPSTAVFPTHAQTNITPKMNTWKALRDARVVKQDLDFSCGAASLATIMNEFYGQNITEESLLKAMNKSDGRASFADMQAALPKFGFMAQGFAADYAQLQSLKISVLVYLKHRKDDHFSVLRGINETTVWLADSSLGNRTYSKAQFLSMWQTRDSSEGLYGKILAVVPRDSNTPQATDFFTKIPVRQSNPALSVLQTRNLP